MVQLERQAVQAQLVPKDLRGLLDLREYKDLVDIQAHKVQLGLKVLVAPKDQLVYRVLLVFLVSEIPVLQDFRDKEVHLDKLDQLVAPGQLDMATLAPLDLQANKVPRDRRASWDPQVNWGRKDNLDSRDLQGHLAIPDQLVTLVNMDLLDPLAILVQQVLRGHMDKLEIMGLKAHRGHRGLLDILDFRAHKVNLVSLVPKAPQEIWVLLALRVIPEALAQLDNLDPLEQLDLLEILE